MKKVNRRQFAEALTSDKGKAWISKDIEGNDISAMQYSHKGQLVAQAIYTKLNITYELRGV